MANETSPRNPSRRTFLRGVAAAGATYAIASAFIDRIGADQAAPLVIDAHGHTRPELTPDRIGFLMDSSGIGRMLLMGYGTVQDKEGQYRSLDPLTVSIYNQYPDRILPFVSTMYAAWNKQDPRMLSVAESQLETGIFKGVGEVMLRYYATPAYNEPEINNPADSDFIKKLSDIVVKYDAVMIAHMEPERDAIRSLENLLDYNKNLKLVWAHCGSTARTIPQSTIGDMMNAHPNLYTDISGIQPNTLCPTGGARRSTIVDLKGNLLPEFKKILQDHTNRVMFGLDTPWPENWSQGSCTFPKWTEWGKNVVAQLDDAGAAEAVMHKNAEQLFKI